ncbi:hypothetical protein HWD97_22910 [Ochrobactrum sp. C6C9]|uniref:hypothetical protein n=1 Tax=Ochrobactrum sp. C6C9 TaxID=2736662 RepID=UPI0035305419|nr:hypothetical protein [Ochrobactrum sp. C6C9]
MLGQNDYRRPEPHSLGAFLYRGLKIIETDVPELSFSPPPTPTDVHTADPSSVTYGTLRSAISREITVALPNSTPAKTIEQVTDWRMSAIELQMLPHRNRKNGPCFSDFFSIPERVIYAVYFRHALEAPQISEHARRKKVAGYLNIGIPNGQKGWGFKVGQIRSVTEACHPRNFTRAYRAFRNEPSLFERLFTIHFQLTYDYVIALDAIYRRAVRTKNYVKLSGIDLVEEINRRENLLKLVMAVLDSKNRQAA